MNNELKDGYLLKYEETFNKEKVIFENTKVISFTLLFIFFSNFASMVIFLLMIQGYRIFILENKICHSLEEILFFATKKSMIKCPKRIEIDYNNKILLQILHVKKL
jgi:hypothetical protein